MSLANGMEKEMAAHSSVLAGESQGQESLLGCCLRGRRVGHNWSNLAAAAAAAANDSSNRVNISAPT